MKRRWTVEITNAKIFVMLVSALLARLRSQSWRLVTVANWNSLRAIASRVWTRSQIVTTDVERCFNADHLVGIRYYYFLPLFKYGRKFIHSRRIFFCVYLPIVRAEYPDRTILNLKIIHYQVFANLPWNVTELVRFIKYVRIFFSKSIKVTNLFLLYVPELWDEQPMLCV